MVEGTSIKHPFNWRPSLHTGIGTFAAFFLLIMWSANADLLYILIIVPIASVIFLVRIAITKPRNRLSILSMLTVFGAISWILMQHWFEVRATGRWLLWSRSYKAQVLSRPAPHNGELKHIEWDGWGFSFAETNVYLVFDSNNLLSQEIKRHSSGKFSGIPGEIWKLHRLQGPWFYAVFYTDTRWE